MLTRLTINDVVLIQALDLSFGDGFSVLTGETGAGKSILLDSLSLAVGMRGDGGLIRQGAEQARVTAVFDLTPFPEQLRKILEEQGIDTSSEELILSRTLQQNNRSKAFVNNQPVSIAFLKELGQHLVDIHGQFDHLLDSTHHERILDQFTHLFSPDFGEILTQLEKTHTLWQAHKRDLDAFYERQREMQSKRQHYELLLRDLNSLKPQKNEEADLLEKRAQVAHYAKLCHATQEVYSLLHSPTDLAGALVSAHKILHKSNTVNHSGMTAVCQMLENASIEVAEAMSQLKDLSHLFGGDAQETQAIEERLHALRSVARHHHITEDLHETWCTIQSTLQGMEDGSLDEKNLRKLVDQSFSVLKDLSQQAHEKRQKSAKEIERLVNQELPDLKLPHAQFSVVFNHRETITPKGHDAIEFHAVTNKGQPFAPLHKVASGGEMARFMLALKMVLWRTQTGTTLIFDEIDTGVGGAAAAAIGQRLQRLGTRSQVLAITHSPQVAAYGQKHFNVQKNDSPTHTTTTVMELSPQQRQEEIARMLSGEHITPQALAAAETLLNTSKLRVVLQT
jgi:DNA repair protein RecN (Recombination protein N)